MGKPIVHHHSGTTQGTWMKDPLGLLGFEKIWYINGYCTNKVLEFESMAHFKAGKVAKTYTLPYNIDGTGSVIYGCYLYFNRLVQIVIKIHLLFQLTNYHCCDIAQRSWKETIVSSTHV